MKFRNMLLDLVQYNNIEIPTKTLKSTSILKEYIQPCTFLLQTLKAYLYMDTLKFTLRKTWKGVLVCCKKFHFLQNFCQFGKVKIIKKRRKPPLVGGIQNKQPICCFVLVGPHKLLLRAKRLAEGPAHRETAEPATPPDSANYISRCRQFYQ